MSNLKVVRAGYAAFQNGDIEGVLNLCDSAVAWSYYGSVPWAGEFPGRDGARRFFGILAEAIEFEIFEVREFVDGGEDIAAFGRTVARAKGTGQRIEDHWAHLFRVRDGRIVRFVGYDTAPFDGSTR
jgi:ketosteroid isomerase-like protein